MTSRLRLPLLPIFVSALSLAGVAWWASQQPRPEPPHGTAALAGILMAGVVYAVATLARAERWHQILVHAGIPSGRRDSYALTTVGYMGNNVLPARAGELLRVFVMAPRTSTRKRDVLATIVAERLLDVVALAMIFLVVAVTVVRAAAVPPQGVLLLMAVGAALVALVALVLSSPIGTHLLSARSRSVLQSLSGPARQLLSVRGAALLALSAAIWALEAGVYYAVGLAVDLGMGPVEALYVVALTNLFALVPAAPGYVGTFDAAVLFGVQATGAGGAAVVGYLLLLRFVLFVPITLVGLGALLARYGGLAVYRAARLEGLRA